MDDRQADRLLVALNRIAESIDRQTEVTKAATEWGKATQLELKDTVEKQLKAVVEEITE
ncbi:hypothetical protein KKA53_05420 [Candidatus Dependentiae bacterium]|nr:hypothetical protein [Candidatus Dependentiae bacterium]